MMIRRRFRDEDAVTPIVSTLLLITIMLTIISAMLYWSIPEIHRIEWDTQYRTSMSGFEAFDSALEDVILDGMPGSTRSVKISVPAGTFSYRTASTRWFISYSVKNTTDFEIEGIETEYLYPKERTSFAIYITPEEVFNLRIRWIDGKGTIVAEQTWFNIHYGEEITPQYPFFPNNTIKEVEFRITDTSGTLLGYAMIFPIDRLEIRIPSDFGTAIIASENAALLDEYGSSPYLRNPPLISYQEEDSELNLDLINMNVSGFRSVGRGNWLVTLRLEENTFTRIEGVYNVRMRVFGYFSDAWNQYLITDYLDWWSLHPENVTGYNGFIPARMHPVSETHRLDGVYLNADGAVTVKLIKTMVRVSLRSA